MAMNLALQEEGFSDAEDHSWLGSAIGTDRAFSGTLKSSTFLTAFPTGVVPSGVFVTKVGGTGSDKNLLKLRTAGSAEAVIATRTSTGGTVLVGYEGRVGTATVAATAAGFTLAALQAGLDSIPDLDAGYLKASAGSAGGPLTVTGPTGVDLGLLSIDNTNATGGTITLGAPTTVTEGGKAEGQILQMVDVNGMDQMPVAIYWGPGRVIVANLPDNSGWDESVPADLPTVRFEV